MNTQLSAQTAAVLLEKLAGDDDFREWLLGDPVAAMATLGVTIDQGSVPVIRRLPSKAEARANAESISSTLQSQTAMVIFFFT